MPRSTDVAVPQPVPLCPFDPLVWYRPRLRALFGVDWRLEAYKRPASRAFGYYFMPIILGRELVARLALRKNGRSLELENVEVLPGHQAGDALSMTLSLLQAWSSTQSVRVPAELQERLSG